MVRDEDKDLLPMKMPIQALMQGGENSFIG